MSSKDQEPKKEKNLFWTVRVANAMPDFRHYMKTERQQYRTDVKALVCRGNLSEADTNQI